MMKEYRSVVRAGKSSTRQIFEKGVYIVVQEKIDGSNGSFELIEDGDLNVYSRTTQLSGEKRNSLNGFYGWVHENVDKSLLDKKYVYYGEWTDGENKLKYNEEYNKQFFLFDIFDKETESYLPYSEVVSINEKLNFLMPHVFYEGEFISYEHVESFIGQSAIGSVGEGVVVKSNLVKWHEGMRTTCKLVSDKFSEVQKQRKPKNPNFKSECNLKLSEFVTANRVEKIYYKLVNEHYLSIELSFINMRALINNLFFHIRKDVLKEESDELLDFTLEEIDKEFKTLIPVAIRELIRNNDRN